MAVEFTGIEQKQLGVVLPKNLFTKVTTVIRDNILNAPIFAEKVREVVAEQNLPSRAEFDELNRKIDTLMARSGQLAKDEVPAGTFVNKPEEKKKEVEAEPAKQPKPETKPVETAKPTGAKKKESAPKTAKQPREMPSFLGGK